MPAVLLPAAWVRGCGFEGVATLQVSRRFPDNLVPQLSFLKWLAASRAVGAGAMSYHYLVLNAVFLLRVWEAAYSWRRLSEDRKAGVAEAIAEPIFPAMVGLHVAWLAGCFLEVMLGRPEFQAWLVLPMLVLWGLALALRAWVILTLGECWNVRLIKRKIQPVIASGPFHYVRHPNYAAVILEIAVVPLLVGAYWTALAATLANAFVLWRRIAGEEAYLMQNPAYRNAFAHKARLVPGLF